MQLTLLLPGLQVPAGIARDLARSLESSPLAMRLTRARQQKLEDAGDGESARAVWLARELFHAAAPASTAPYAWADLAGERVIDGHIWHADPVHIELGRERLRAQVLCEPPSELEADALIADANELLAVAGARLLRAASNWFLRSTHPWVLDAWPMPSAAGTTLGTDLPSSDDALRWTRVHNEIQMCWHEHAVNAAREARGAPTIDGLWLHGGGRWQPLAPIAYTRVVAASPALRGAAAAASVPATDALDAPPVEGALLVWDDADHPRDAQDWRSWLNAVGRIDQRFAALPDAGVIDVVLTGHTRVRTLRSRKRDLWHVWQRTDLAAVLAEPQ